MRKVKTPRVRHRNLTLSLPITLYRQIERRARRSEMSRSAWVRQLVELWMDHK